MLPLPESPIPSSSKLVRRHHNAPTSAGPLPPSPLSRHTSVAPEYEAQDKGKGKGKNRA